MLASIVPKLYRMRLLVCVRSGRGSVSIMMAMKARGRSVVDDEQPSVVIMSVKRLPRIPDVG